MQGKGKKLKDANGQYMYPLTRSEFVYVEDNKTLAQRLIEIGSGGSLPVNITSTPTNGNILTYNSANGKWEAKAPSGNIGTIGDGSITYAKLADNFASGTPTSDCNTTVKEGKYLCSNGILNFPPEFQGQLSVAVGMILEVSRVSSIWVAQKAYLRNNSSRVWSRVIDSRYPENVVPWEIESGYTMEGLKWIGLGDSIALQVLPSVAKYLKTTVNNQAKGGSACSNREGINDTLYGPYESSAFWKISSTIDFTSYDLVTCTYGGNDFGSGVPLGTLDSTDPKTFAGAWNTGLKNITNSNPQIAIVMFSPTFRDYAISPNRNGDTFDQFLDMMEAIAKNWRIPLGNAGKLSGVNKHNVVQLTSDGIHPNTIGRQKLAGFYAGMLNSHIYGRDYTVKQSKLNL
ncbi:SGNH/GDSL hydrolase family protein [Bacillus sp. mrc49]|uniref:SGNH/GDSL hydrolase family protein n=1 Tax=Bacillus sp. mrc49 TaxID=2054913 RepID=UPI000C2714FD|nr:SGNH/GDSL hydrolase family protein [Bacillus sp. mrc49]PJN91138.1 hypothetical protein CVN76_06555 [Bacillus sp. mrc49]PJN91224.1 hypothetical protein CVN76_06125 [Bacillus sp. mrc49]PJN91372.1 hypothetical protein CVN76_05365 [Bacillus sp. mrc49]